MLEMRPDCERCDTDLPAHTHGAEGDELARKRSVIEAALARARAKRT